MKPEQTRIIFEYCFDEKLHFELHQMEGYKNSVIHKLHDPKLNETVETHHQLFDLYDRKMEFIIKRIRTNEKSIIFCFYSSSIIVNKT